MASSSRCAQWLPVEGCGVGAGQVPRDRGDGHPGLEDETGLDGEGGLVVENLAPEAGDHELGDDDVNQDAGLGVSP